MPEDVSQALVDGVVPSREVVARATQEMIPEAINELLAARVAWVLITGVGQQGKSKPIGQ